MDKNGKHTRLVKRTCQNGGKSSTVNKARKSKKRYRGQGR